MESIYDRKFAEMQKYIPFLERMIKRLENTGSTSQNPRQVQLDKIRSLRDLLLDTSKRMKLDKLLKLEQVVTNLYQRVNMKDPVLGAEVEKQVVEKAKQNYFHDELLAKELAKDFQMDTN